MIGDIGTVLYWVACITMALALVGLASRLSAGFWGCSGRSPNGGGIGPTRPRSSKGCGGSERAWNLSAPVSFALGRAAVSGNHAERFRHFHAHLSSQPPGARERRVKTLGHKA